MIKTRSSSNIMPTNLGELELQVMQVLWQQSHLDAKKIREGLQGVRVPSLSTVQSALERLHRKDYVARLKQGHAFTYHATVSRGNLLGRMMGEVIQLLHDGKMETILSSFVQVASDMDEVSLDRLEQLIQRHKNQDGE
ncbi:BlaI/MecI/CopY family transcriptional regulator [Pseudohongiella nitratireducens]|uniref:BlaI/MecI/CopY family transcriptional regulator n=1 Tax=Pseudohongiella nitratireducens TaxID=1768907 RepID=UPI002409F156|nr:BlaI/MecI/CopY family transcriptional regulator [Pseudohongiella nitratireducens]MDF1622403.1 BlaI/MecI/CopY family transcriptional regulator [Pseudohongiella nitratireducens]|tara:strand:+ start:10950 stop:11363 length:414 start_codon:yes stop_codon:yes gene_type:complete